MYLKNICTDTDYTKTKTDLKVSWQTLYWRMIFHLFAIYIKMFPILMVLKMIDDRESNTLYNGTIMRLICNRCLLTRWDWFFATPGRKIIAYQVSLLPLPLLLRLHSKGDIECGGGVVVVVYLQARPCSVWGLVMTQITGRLPGRKNRFQQTLGSHSVWFCTSPKYKMNVALQWREKRF